MAKRIHQMQDPRGTHWIPPAAGERGEVGEFIGGDGGGCGSGGMEAVGGCGSEEGG